MPKKFYITTPIYYVNASPHIGHTYTTLAADILARYHRMIGEKVFFLTGTDEHGAKIEEKAREAGKSPKEFADEVAASFQFAWDEFNISSDRFIRTTEETHIKAAQNALQFMYDKGDIYLGKYEGLYCRGCEQYLHEKDLADGLCPDHKIVPEKMSEESYMFKLSKYGKEIIKKIKKDEFKILPVERKNEVLSFVKSEGLKDISFSRKNVKWGISLPWDKSHTAYVWADAFLNYLTGINWSGPTALKAVGPLTDFWPPNIHLMSKDILRVHATIWPAMLLSLGLPLPRQLFIHGFFMIDGEKMSKSLGNVITPNDLVKRYGVDAARYLLISATPFGHDGDVSWGKFDEKYNADLANGLGNLVARSITLIQKMREAGIELQKTQLEEITIATDKTEEWNKIIFLFPINMWWNSYKINFEKFLIDHVLFFVSNIVSQLDGYITTTKPWELIKNNDKRVEKVMYNILEILRHAAWMLWPFMPDTAEKIWECLGLNIQEELKKNFKKATKWGGLAVDTKVKKSEILFPRL